ncbi:hypothetical protein GE09DRAFT_1112349 [Coniochaeta sp. 2T2.1]|nr:hypothetical protein GE09DRAFT_1112349 [Coniochaeta sp. 2T2.1]
MPIVILWRFLCNGWCDSSKVVCRCFWSQHSGLSSIPFAASSHHGLIKIDLSVFQRQENVYISTYPSRLSPSSSVLQSR